MMAELQVEKGKTDNKAKLLQKEKEDLKEANEALRKEQEKSHKALVLSAGLAQDRGLAACEQGHTAEGLLWLARALEILPKKEQLFQEVLRTHAAVWASKLVRLEALHHYPSPIVDAKIRPDGEPIVLLVDANNSVELWVGGKPFGPPLPRKNQKFVGGFSPDGRHVLICTGEKTARVWDTTTGLAAGPPLVHDSPLFSAEFCPISKRAVTQSSLGVHFWDWTMGETIGPPRPHQLGAFTPFMPDDATMVTGTNRNITVWDLAKKEPLRVIPHGKKDAFCRPVFSADGRIALLMQNQLMRLCDLSTGKSFGDPVPYHGNLTSQAVFSPDGKLFLTGALGEVQFRDIATGKPLGKPLLLDKGEKWSIMLSNFMGLSPDGKIAVTYMQGAQLWDVARRELIGQIPRHESYIDRVAFAPDGKTVLTRTKQTTRLWRLPADLGQGLSLQQKGVIFVLAFRPGGKEFLVAHHVFGSKLEQVHAHDLASGKLLQQVAECPEDAKGVAFSPDGRLVALARAYYDLQLWDTVSGKTTGPAAAPAKDFISALAFNPAGTLILSGHSGQNKGALRLWDAKTGLPIGTPLPVPQPVRALAFSPDGKEFLVANKHEAQLWDLATQKPVGQPLPHQSSVFAVAFSPDGKKLLTAAGTVQFWDRTTGQPLGQSLTHPFHPLTHFGGVTVLAYSPNGKLLLIGGGPGVQLWQVADQKPLGLLLPHPSQVTAAAFSHDGKTLLVGGTGGHVRSWQVPMPVPGSVERILLWSQVATGLELDDQGALHLLDAAAWKQRHQQLQEQGGPPNF